MTTNVKKNQNPGGEVILFDLIKRSKYFLKLIRTITVTDLLVKLFFNIGYNKQIWLVPSRCDITEFDCIDIVFIIGCGNTQNDKT